jgi:hypothetical protein
MTTLPKHWRWMPGMHTDDGLLVISVSESGWLRTAKALDFRPAGNPLPVSVGECAAATKRPNIDHPATLGCVEHGLITELYGADAHLMAWENSAGGTVWTVLYRPESGAREGQWLMVDGGNASKKQALLAALEAKP